MEWYLKVWKQYAVFRGRARRKEYWMFLLIYWLTLLVAYGLSFALTSVSSILGGIISSLIGLYSLALLVPSIAVLVRRLHDVGKGGGWIFIYFVPVVGIFWLLILLVTDSEIGENRFGPNPKGIGNQDISVVFDNL
jgi:uncharacterized membrane protein YhaH (DUF805 family)